SKEDVTNEMSTKLRDALALLMRAVGEQAGQSSAEAVEASPTKRSPRLERRESHQQVNASTQRGPAI
ncbi:MAG: hypothetical protein SGPRY_002022, partial [Prymnesium sp.]